MDTSLHELASPALIDAIVIAMALEAVLLRRLGQRRPLEFTWAGVLSLLLPGVFLLLAVRAALAGSPSFVLVALLGALLAHLHEIRRRLQAGGQSAANAPPPPSHSSI